MNVLFLDLETYNDVPLNVGTAKYAETVEILLVGYAWNAEPVRVMDLTASADRSAFVALVTAMALADRVVAHNAFFDRTCLTAVWGSPPVPITRWHCTMARAYAHSLPGSLAALGALFKLGVEQAKHTGGKNLVQLFCKPRPKNSVCRRATATTHPVEWARFVAYCAADVGALRTLYHKLPTWNWMRQEEQAWWLDQIINDRGMAIDVELAHAALATVADHQRALQHQTAAITGTTLAVTQRDELLALLLNEYGVALPNMQASTLERRLDDEDLPEPVRDLLRIRLAMCQTSNTKWKKLVQATSSDGRLRGTSQFCGAARTGRSAGRVFQPLNLPRPPPALKSRIDGGIALIKARCADLFFRDPSELASAALRGAIIAPPGQQLVVCDFANIEGRVLAWLAGEQWKLQAFADFDAGAGHDLYVLGYANAFNVAPRVVLDDAQAGGPMRLIGKIQELACGYGGSVGAFDKMSKAFGLDLKRPRVKEIVTAWRASNAAIVKFWYALDDAFATALEIEREAIRCGPLEVRRDGPWLRIKLPSGRFLCYPAVGAEPVVQVRVCVAEEETAWIDKALLTAELRAAHHALGGSPDLDQRTRPKLFYHGVNQYTRQWGKLYTYGAKLVENVTQAMARDLLTQALPRIEAAGYAIVMHVYDEVVAEVPVGDAHTADGLRALMTRPLAWAPGLPLAASAFAAPRYRKD